MSYLISFITLYKPELEELQKIRNAFIHINRDSVNNLKALKNFYIFRADQTLLDILETKNLVIKKFVSIL